MKYTIYLSLLFAVLFISSCNSDKKNAQNNVSDVTGEEVVFAQSLFGDNASLMVKQDFTGQGKKESLVGVLNKKINDNTFWLQKAAVVQKTGNAWIVLIGMDRKIGNQQHNLIEQIEASFGYIVELDNSVKPVKLRIFISNQNGQPASDEIALAWDKNKSEYFVEGNVKEPLTPR